MRFYEGCTALITGASSGLGEEFALQLAPYAGTLILVARRKERLDALRNELLSVHRDLTVFTYVADLSRTEDRQAMAEWLPTQGLHVDFLINNAGLGDRGAFSSSDWGRINSMLEVNIAALTHLTHLLVPAMLQSGRAAVLNVSSVAGLFPLPNMAVYSATKAYVSSFSESLSMELRPKGITVTSLCPGPVPTEFFDVARRSEEDDRGAHYESMPAFVVTAQEAARTGLEAVARDRVRAIPGPLLAVAVGAALLVPFFITRQILRALSNKL